jgi:uncharacterized membrane protein YidH (DUF202 family)
MVRSLARPAVGHASRLVCQLQVECGRAVISVDPLRELGKVLVVVGAVLAIAGLLMWLGAKLPFRLGRLPGDIVYHGRNTTFYFPIVTCIVLSLVLTLILWIINLFRR